jgi:hypothetical protein
MKGQLDVPGWSAQPVFLSTSQISFNGISHVSQGKVRVIPQSSEIHSYNSQRPDQPTDTSTNCSGK